MTRVLPSAPAFVTYIYKVKELKNWDWYKTLPLTFHKHDLCFKSQNFALEATLVTHYTSGLAGEKT